MSSQIQAILSPSQSPAWLITAWSAKMMPVSCYPVCISYSGKSIANLYCSETHHFHFDSISSTSHLLAFLFLSNNNNRNNILRTIWKSPLLPQGPNKQKYRTAIECMLTFTSLFFLVWPTTLIVLVYVNVYFPQVARCYIIQVSWVCNESVDISFHCMSRPPPSL